jgi:hypothetical protein
VHADFLSIDCGVEANFSGNTDKSTGIVYVSDEPYTDAGDNRRIAPDREGRLEPRFQTLRSFPSGERNCYALPTVAGTKYLARAEFAYGNYDGKNSSSLEFDLHLGPNRWETFQLGPGEASSSDYYRREAIFVAWAGWAPLCFVNTGGGTPFVNVVELRPLGAGLYPQVAPGLIISRYWRQDMGANVPTWYFLLSKLYSFFIVFSCMSSRYNSSCLPNKTFHVYMSSRYNNAWNHNYFGPFKIACIKILCLFSKLNIIISTPNCLNNNINF